jgi:Protein of unknown function (DUF3313)
MSFNGVFRNLTCLLFAALVTVAGCESTPVPVEHDPFQPDPNTFEALPGKTSLKIYRRAGASLAPYSNILIRPLEIELREGWNPQQNANDKTILSTAREQLAALFHEEMRKVLESSGTYHVVSSSGPDVIEMKPQIIGLYVKAVDEAGESNVSVYEIHDARLTLAGDLCDSMTGTRLFRFYDYRAWEQAAVDMSTREARAEVFRKLVAGWANELKQAVDRARAE